MKSRTWMWTTVVYLFAALALPVWTAAQDKPSPNQQQHHHYKLIDLGTFGGPASYTVNNLAGDGSYVLNHRGMLTGSADTSTPDPYAPNCSNPDCFVSHTFRWDDGVLTDLGALPGGYTSYGYGINERGWIAGASQNGAIDPLTHFPEGRPVLWTDDQIIDLGTLGGYEGLGIYVNNAGQVVGLSTINGTPDPYSFLGAPTHTFIWQNGVMQDLGTLGGPDSFPGAGGVNQHKGLVAGGSFTNSTPNPVTGVPTMDPFLWKDGYMHDLGTLGGTLCCQGTVVANSRGQVVGDSNLAGDLTHHPFLWDEGVLTDLGTLGGNNGSVGWINDAGDVAGTADLSASGHDAFLWKGGVMTDLGNLGVTSSAYAVNSEDQVVGASRVGVPGDARAFLWENGGPIVDLNTLIPANSSLLLGFAVNINERGEITGLGVPAGCSIQNYLTCGHVFVLIPCDEQHPGQCEDYSMIEVASAENTASAPKHPVTIQQGNESPTETVNNLRNLLRQRYHIPGQTTVPRD